VFINNFVDRDIDAKMQRTRNRVTVNGENVRPKRFFFHGVVLGIVGFLFTRHFSLN